MVRPTAGPLVGRAKRPGRVGPWSGAQAGRGARGEGRGASGVTPPLRAFVLLLEGKP